MKRFAQRSAWLYSLMAVVLVAGSVFAAFSSGANAQDEKVLRIHQSTFPENLDPQKSSFTSEIAVLALNYEGLTRQDSELNTVPAAAESWEFNEDATQLTFHIRDGLTYSDGTPITSENFRFAVERTCDPNTAGEYQGILFEITGCADFAAVDPADSTAYDTAKAALGATTPDEKTLVLNFSVPAPYYATVASLWVFYPVRADLVTGAAEDWWKDPAKQIGNGPFQMTGYDEGLQISFEANPNYWGGSPLLNGIEYVYQGESAIAIEAFRAGDLDIVDVDASQLPAVSADSSLSENLVQYAVASSYQLSFNLNMEPFNDIKVRQAFSQAFDRETYCGVIRNGDCLPTLSWIPLGLPGSIETDLYGFDPEAAKAALAESSYGSAEALPEITMYFNSNDSANTARAEWVAGQYKEILGVDITLAPTEGTALTALRKDPSTFPQMLLVGGWIQDYPDPQNWLSVYWKCDAAFAQRFGYCNEELDAILAKADTSTDQAERLALYQQAGEMLVNDIPGPFLYNGTQTSLVNPNVTGYTATALDAEWPGQFTSLLTIDKTS
ncbi:MAG: peptide ABC transporter substrate-binding protein [Thermomicrobiales bacterium]